MLINSNLIIDGGGTSSKGVILKTGEIFESGPGNVLLDFDNSIKSYELLSRRINEKYLIGKIKIYSAGYTSLTKENKERFKIELVRIFKNDNIEINSDSVMALESLGEKTSSITLGTGTSITTNINKRIETLYGMGHLIFEPMSGLGIMRRFITKIFNMKESDLINITLGYLGFQTFPEFIEYIYKHPNDKKLIARPFAKILNDSKTNWILFEVIKEEFKLFNSPEVEYVLSNSEKIILNGSVAKNEKISKLFYEKYEKQIFYKNDSFYDIAKRIEEKW